MITQLTKDQEILLTNYRKEMLAYGRSTEPSDRKTTEESITFFYKQINKLSPRFFWFDGPFSGLLAVEIMKKGKGGLGDNLWENLEENLGENLRNNLWNNLWENLEENLGENLGKNLGENLNKMFFGQHELYWITYYVFCSLIGIQYENLKKKILDTWLNIGKSTGWWLPFENICFCFERPNILNIDNKGKLHCSSGPAIGFKDGFSLYYWHGEQIPAEITKDSAEIETKIKTWRAFKNV